MILGIHHVQLTIPVGKEEEGRDFYCKVLGLKEKEKPKSLQGRGGFWLQAGPHEIHVGTEDGMDRAKTKAHLAYQVDDLKYWRDKLQEHKIEMIESIPIEGYDRFEFRDPFGNRVEMIQAI
ncbi:VOC family protein [Mangrovibacillus cuniculi]|uniref:Glyoxalase n=1 Tax=Mangrovibacillus cuniculi TaxID=2593652 RepID=A0A7S8C9H4_9BACI|nr:VOC family protein [Mangrovibacillus cuniculi]QPC45885.1 glyoxalase [Mangrovibacillus cuniculi]